MIRGGIGSEGKADGRADLYAEESIGIETIYHRVESIIQLSISQRAFSGHLEAHASDWASQPTEIELAIHVMTLQWEHDFKISYVIWLDQAGYDY